MTQPGTPAPGWYPDPDGAPGMVRWWNGVSWSDVATPAGPGVAVRQAPALAPPRPPSGAVRVLVGFLRDPSAAGPPRPRQADRPGRARAGARRGRRRRRGPHRGRLRPGPPGRRRRPPPPRRGRPSRRAPCRSSTGGRHLLPVPRRRLVRVGPDPAHGDDGDGGGVLHHPAPGARRRGVHRLLRVRAAGRRLRLDRARRACWRPRTRWPTSLRTNYYPAPNDLKVLTRRGPHRRRARRLALRVRAVAGRSPATTPPGRRPRCCWSTSAEPAPALLWISIPNTHAELYGDIDTVLAGVHVL